MTSETPLRDWTPEQHRACKEMLAALKPEEPWTPEGRRAWGSSLVKTGTEHFDLSMVRRGKQMLKEAEEAERAAPPKP